MFFNSGQGLVPIFEFRENTSRNPRRTTPSCFPIHGPHHLVSKFLTKLGGSRPSTADAAILFLNSGQGLMPIFEFCENTSESPTRMTPSCFPIHRPRHLVYKFLTKLRALAHQRPKPLSYFLIFVRALAHFWVLGPLHPIAPPFSKFWARGIALKFPRPPP